jgi:two-component system NtrC family sensor kinase
VQSGKLAAIGELTAGVAHQINNPLFAVLGLVELLLRDAEPGSKAEERLRLVQESGLEIKEVVRSLLEFARGSADGRQLFALEQVVLQAVNLVRRTSASKGVALVERYEADGALVHASPNQITQSFLALLTNARQAMPDGGSVTIDVRRAGAEALATVADTGPGIAPELQPHIFEPFFTTRPDSGGTGLGVSVSRLIAEAHGGSLTVDSQPGRGAAFTLRLPLAGEE